MIINYGNLVPFGNQTWASCCSWNIPELNGRESWEHHQTLHAVLQKDPFEIPVDASHQVLPDPRLTAFQGQVAEGEGERKEKGGSQMKAGKIHMRGFSEWASGGF